MTKQKQGEDIRFKLAKPVVFERRKKKKTPKAFDDIAHTERYLTRAVRHTITAAESGLTAYGKAKRKSRSKNGKRYTLDTVPNVAVGSAVAMRKLTIVPIDLMRAFYSSGSRKVMRRGLEAGARAASRLLLH